MSDVSGSWHPDPFGRFAQRYHDGTQWTEHVVDASGAQTTDPPVQTPAPAAAAPPTAAGYGAPPAAGYGQPGYGAPAPTTTGGGAGLAIGPGLIVAAVGALLVILSVFALGWISGENPQTGKDETANLSDVRDTNDDLEQVDYEYGVVPALYIDFLYLLGVVAAALGAVAALNKDLAAKLKMPAIIAGAVFLALHLYAGFNANSQISNFFEDNGADATSLAIGFYAGALGYIGAIVGAVLGPKPES